jgi:hypothetical protein
VDTRTGERTNLRTGDRKAARKLVDAKNNADEQPALNLQIAKAYLAGTDRAMTTRTWRDAFAALTATKRGPTQERWLRAVRELLTLVEEGVKTHGALRVVG